MGDSYEPTIKRIRLWYVTKTLRNYTEAESKRVANEVCLELARKKLVFEVHLRDVQEQVSVPRMIEDARQFLADYQTFQALKLSAPVRGYTSLDMQKPEIRVKNQTLIELYQPIEEFVTSVHESLTESRLTDSSISQIHSNTMGGLEGAISFTRRLLLSEKERLDHMELDEGETEFEREVQKSLWEFTYSASPRVMRVVLKDLPSPNK